MIAVLVLSVPERANVTKTHTHTQRSQFGKHFMILALLMFIICFMFLQQKHILLEASNCLMKATECGNRTIKMETLTCWLNYNSKYIDLKLSKAQCSSHFFFWLYLTCYKHWQDNFQFCDMKKVSIQLFLSFLVELLLFF